MKYYISVKFDLTGKSYYFATDDESIKIGDLVVVETIVGTEVGEVVTYPRDLASLHYDKEIKPIVRKADKQDLLVNESNQKLAKQANQIFEEQVKLLNLDMRLIGSQYTFDKSKILFIYVADERVDFRELLKVLANLLHCRIELKQINSRERAQMVGGLGTCGLPLCCSTFLTQFEGVSLNKAKNQMLAINIPKLSGQCGKLMCCLKCKDDLYTEIKKDYPPINFRFKYNGEEYKVTTFNIFTKILKIQSATSADFITLDEFYKACPQFKPNFKQDNITQKVNKPISNQQNNQKTLQKTNKNNAISQNNPNKKENFNKNNLNNKPQNSFKKQFKNNLNNNQVNKNEGNK